MLAYPLRWLLNELFPDYGINFAWADLSRLISGKVKLSDRISLGLEYYPCELLFIHRDAEGQPFEQRIKEIETALEVSGKRARQNIPVVPTRMTEAWFLHDEQAIRLAAGNPNGTMPLSLPNVKNVHQISDPKELLEKLLREATGLNKRRLKRFKPRREMHRLGELIKDYSLLREQQSFRHLESSLETLRATVFY